MKNAARLPLSLVAAASLMTGCVYAPVLQSTYPFAQHPGVAMEVWTQYDAYGYGYTVMSLVNRSSVDKCAWTATQDGRLLRSGESWQVNQVQSPGAVGIANVQPSDPTCANARRTYGSSTG
ncbi:hypothetical protein H8N03_22845 [Ramlibacter sp. USB13]|uniref:Uncharacterized protein n=1 Tax=Ramlibacter cellulosilyticus TaxID=2764187 RepID=A0A923MVH7_9BURK|nr:hypothetical protein [Ramlibacter cellulosilyticus]MBC5785796.1 hypothetical protein [Ramlibacter cellulosilyticus]